MSFWSSALDHLSDYPPQPNPFPPLGSGKKPRPTLLYVPDFEPPPPTPSPLFAFQLPAKPAAKPAWNPQPERRRRLKVWDLLPDPPQPVAPQKPQHSALRDTCGVPEGSHDMRNGGIKVAAPPQASVNPCGAAKKAIPRQLGRLDLGSMAGGEGEVKSNVSTSGNGMSWAYPSWAEQAKVDLEAGASPRTADILSAIMWPECGSHARAVVVSGSIGSTGSRLQRREGFHCGVDLSALWGVLVEFIWSPTPGKSLPYAPCACSACSGYTSSEQTIGCTVEEEEVTLWPKFGSGPPGTEGSDVDFRLRKDAIKGPLQSLRQENVVKGKYNSPLSVLSPMSAEKSSTHSSPSPLNSLIAFVDRHVAAGIL